MPRIPQDSTYQETFIGEDNFDRGLKRFKRWNTKILNRPQRFFFFIYLRGKLRGATRDHFPYK